MKGMIALDIDGTLTEEHHFIEKEVIHYLEALVKKDWTLIFITGRCFSRVEEVLRPLSFPFYLSLQNGAITVEMPKKTILRKQYVSTDVFLEMEKICLDEPSDFVLYSGIEHKDFCFYRPKKFSKDLLAYLERRFSELKEHWVKCQDYQSLSYSAYPSLKCFGKKESAKRIAKKIESKLFLHAPLNFDPFEKGYYVVQITNSLATKGSALDQFILQKEYLGPVIAAGDDFNDLDMLKRADIKIVMETADPEIKKIADIIAPPARDNGIITGLEEAIKKVKDINV